MRACERALPIISCTLLTPPLRVARQPFPSPVDMAPVELHEAFKMAGSLFTAFETSTPFPRDTADSRLLVSDLCVMIGNHFDSLGCYSDRADQRGSSRSASQTTKDTESRARGGKFTRSCELLLGNDGCITVDVDDVIEQHTSSTSKSGALQQGGSCWIPSTPSLSTAGQLTPRFLRRQTLSTASAGS